MNFLAIDEAAQPYEGNGAVWFAIYPPPFIAAASHADPCEESDQSLAMQYAPLVFREDTFDAVTRIRRGRFYALSQEGQPAQLMYVAPHPTWGAWGGRRISADSPWVERRCFKYEQIQFNPLAAPDWKSRPIVIGSCESAWRLIASERISTGEWLATLKARHALGVLPEVDQAKIPESGRAKAIETIDTLINAAYRESPESIVDRARAAAQWCFATWAAAKFKDDQLLTSDLAQLATEVEKRAGECKPEMAIWNARGLARLHSRAKPNEQERRDTRPVMEADAEYALASMGLLLRELGWAA
ncbi:MAG: hypothetical protein ACYCOY_14155 [Metallibacterium sp.]